MKQSQLSLINKSKIVFWDFDGIIKESLKVKEKTFLELFKNRKPSELKEIALYHRNNGGVSRVKKIKYFYKEIFNIDLPKDRLSELCAKFALLVENRVVNSRWAPGVKKILKNKKKDQLFYLLTGTPDNEIKNITKKLNIDNLFEAIYGYPNNKDKIVREILRNKMISSKNTLFIGDAKTDYNAAKLNKVPFVLRKNRYNSELQKIKSIEIIDNFLIK
tara:strand:+ start:1775 stop:2428 length:654 start_codon:yes stop_codon:yes gene_type:complete